MPVISVNGTNVPYTATGTGPGFVLLHGTSADATSNFAHLVDRFADRRTVIVPDYAGSGESTIPDGELTLDLLVEQAAAVVKAAGGPVDLLGFSLGAVVAAATAAAHPQLVRRLVLIAGWVDGTDARHQATMDTWARLATLDPELFTRFGPLLAFSPAFLASLDREIIAQIFSMPPPPATRRQIELDLCVDIGDRLAAITAPTLVIGCTHDYLVPVGHSRTLHKGITGSRYAAIDSGHVVLHEQPDELVRLVRDFLFEAGAA